MTALQYQTIHKINSFQKSFLLLIAIFNINIYSSFGSITPIPDKASSSQFDNTERSILPFPKSQNTNNGLTNSFKTINGTTYYVNTTGNNSDGLTPAKAWTSMTKINSTLFKPGDKVLFEGGKTFIGNITIDSSDGNDPANPVIFSSYGNGKATIHTSSTNICGFKSTNTQGIIISNLNFTGPGNGTKYDIDGILFYTTNNSGYLSNIQINNVEVSGFGFCGIRFYSQLSSNVKAGFKRVVVDSCIVHDCRENGIITIGYDDQNAKYYQHYNVRISHCKVYNIPGYASSTHKGSGIRLSQVDSVLIEHCEAFNTGTANTACGGPGGIWLWAANNATIQFCESHHNSSGTSTGCDGLGFDFDGGVTNSLLQYCYSHDNDGAGILLGNFEGARPWGNNVVRYNLSVNDARTNNGPVTLFTAPGTVWNGLKFYNNTIYVTPSVKNNTLHFSAFKMIDYGTNMSGIECYNNIFQTTGNVTLVTVPSTFTTENPKFIGNLYWTTGSKFSITYGNNYSSLASFRYAGTYCEKNGLNDTGLEADPLLTNVNKAPLTVSPLPLYSLNAFQIASNSPAKDAGLDLNSLFGIDVGKNDLWNTQLKTDPYFDIGAYEFSKSTTPNMMIKATSELIKIFPNPAANEFNVMILTKDYKDLEIRISDQIGRVYMLKKVSEPTIKINSQYFSNGIYYLTAKGSEINITVPFVIHK